MHGICLLYVCKCMGGGGRQNMGFAIKRHLGSYKRAGRQRGEASYLTVLLFPAAGRLGFEQRSRRRNYSILQAGIAVWMMMVSPDYRP